MKKALLLVILLVLAAAGTFLLWTARGRAQSRLAYETQPALLGDLLVTVEADGVVHSAQSALLTWRTSGTVEQVNVQVGDSVAAGQVLTSLEQTSLPQALILAQADLIAAQRLLDDLLHSQVEQQQAQQDLADAQQALEDALNPQSAQARAQAALSQAQKALENAQRDVEIAQARPSPDAIRAAYDTLLLWGKALDRTRQEIERLQRRLDNPGAAMTGATRKAYQDQLNSLLLQGVTYQRAFEDARQRYENLLQPPDPVTLAQAGANLASAQAHLEQARREYERIKGGMSPADLAVLRAQVEDARRKADRLKAGPDPDEVAASRARLAAAQAALDLRHQAAPFGGVVTQIRVKPGDRVTPGSPAFRIDDLSELLLEVRASEVDINRIEAGQQVTIRLDSVPERAYAGVVVEVPGVGDSVNNVVSFAVKIEILDADSHIRPEMTAVATIVLEELKEVLLVPSQSVRYLDGQRVVYVLRQGQPAPVDVELGASSKEDVQILEGDLHPGDLIITNPEE